MVSTKPHKFIWLTLALAGVALGIALVSWPEKPVVYQGKDVWQWTWQLYSANPPEHDAATAALRAIGPAAVTPLVRKLRTEESLPRKIREWLGDKLPGTLGRKVTKDLKPISFASIRSMAATGLKALGTNAADAVPALLKAMHDPEAQVMWDAAGALGVVGEPAVLGLIPLIEDKGMQRRRAAIYALGEIGPASLPAVPALIRQFADRDASFRECIAYTLSRIGPKAGPAALKIVEGSLGETRRTAARAVVAIHPRTLLAMPVLITMAQDMEAESRSVAIESLAALRISHTNALAVYRAALRDTNALVRTSAAKALGEVCWKAQDDLPTLAEIEQRDSDEAVRRAARQAREKITALLTNAAPKL